MVAHPEHGKNLEFLYRADGTKVSTSISRQVDFVRSRTRLSKRAPGIVTFNQMIRLFKWWRTCRVTEDDLITELPTFLLELLCAKVFDECGVASTYTETLETWFTALATIIDERREIRFDGRAGPRAPRGESGTRWVVRDPVNPDNLAVPRVWTEAHIDRVHAWTCTASEIVARVRECDQHDNGKGALQQLERLFGPGIRNLSLLEVPSEEIDARVIIGPCCDTLAAAPAMSFSTRSETHRRISNFVDWIRAPDPMEEKIRGQAEEIRSRMKGRASSDGLVVRSTPTAGSYAKRTGLRRHWNPRGGSPVVGQDVDLPFVISPSTTGGEPLPKASPRGSRSSRTSTSTSHLAAIAVGEAC